jgi:cytoskeletal protein RodZ
MAEKVALPSLSLPKQKTHWSVHVVIAASVLFLIMCGALYMVMDRQQKQEDAYAKRQADHAAELRAEIEKTRAETERASAEAKKKEAETAAAAALAAAQKKAAAAEAAAAAEREARKKGTTTPKKNGGGKTVAKSGPTPAQGATPAAPAAAVKQQTKASKDIDDLLKSIK